MKQEWGVADVMAGRLIGGRVILAEDDPLMRGIMSSMLSRAGAEVFSAVNGSEAVALARRFRAGLVLLDIAMPEQNGLMACQQIRALPGYAGVPIIMLTGYNDEPMRRAAHKLGANRFISKPFQPADLLALLDGEHSSLTEPPPSTEQSPARFDRAVLDKTLDLMSPDQVRANLGLLRTREEQVLERLDHQAVASSLCYDVNTLASTAGMFGFAALSAVGRRFERAAALDLPETGSLAQQLQVETTAALATLDEVLRERRMQPA